jgi:hypothetical protein
LGEVTDPELDTLSIENVLEQVEKLLEKHEILSVDIEDSIVGSFALTNEEGTFEMLDSMTGDELKVRSLVLVMNCSAHIFFVL